MPTKNSKTVTENYFGLCPICRETNGYLNIYKRHWFVCHRHKVKWCVGSNLFSSWKLESESQWKKNYDKIWNYDEVRAIYLDE